MTRSLARLLTAAALTLCLAPAAFAQDDDDPAVLKPAEPDYTLGALPTNLRLPKYKSAFRVTHRFLGPLDENGIGDLWGMDVGAQIGLEYRFGIIKNGQIGFYRTSDKTIDLFSQYSVTRQEHGLLDISAVPRQVPTLQSMLVDRRNDGPEQLPELECEPLEFVVERIT